MLSVLIAEECLKLLLKIGADQEPIVLKNVSELMILEGMLSIPVKSVGNNSDIIHSKKANIALVDAFSKQDMELIFKEIATSMWLFFLPLLAYSSGVQGFEKLCIFAIRKLTRYKMNRNSIRYKSSGFLFSFLRILNR